MFSGMSMDDLGGVLLAFALSVALLWWLVPRWFAGAVSIVSARLAVIKHAPAAAPSAPLQAGATAAQAQTALCEAERQRRRRPPAGAIVLRSRMIRNTDTEYGENGIAITPELLDIIVDSRAGKKITRDAWVAVLHVSPNTFKRLVDDHVATKTVDTVPAPRNETVREMEQRRRREMEQRRLQAAGVASS